MVEYPEPQKDRKVFIMRKFISKDQKIKAIVEAIAETPKKREDIAKEYNFKNAATMDSFLRRAGYVIREGIYVLSEEAKKLQSSEAALPADIVAVMNKYNSYIDACVEIPENFHKEFGFTSRQDMQEFLRNNNVIYNPGTQKYELAEGADLAVMPSQPEQEDLQIDASSIGNQEELLAFLFEHKDLICDMMKQSTQKEEFQLPIYKFKGKKLTRSFYLSYSLCLLIDNYCDAHGIKIVDLLTTALAEFFKKYGYTEELNRALGA